MLAESNRRAVVFLRYLEREEDESVSWVIKNYIFKLSPLFFSKRSIFVSERLKIKLILFRVVFFQP